MGKNKIETLDNLEQSRSIGGCPPSLGNKPLRDPDVLVWNLMPTKHAKVSVYRKIQRPGYADKIIKLFRGSPSAFGIWRLNHVIPFDAEIINESIQR